MIKLTFLVYFLMFFSVLHAQLVEVESNYTAGGDVVFGATNFTKTPLFVKIEFNELQNSTSDEMRVFVSRVRPGYNNILTLTRSAGAGYVRVIFKSQTYRSDPMAEVNLDFPYLIPFAPGKKVTVFDVKNIDGFWGEKEPKGWLATGFNASSGDEVYASRTGEIVEIVGAERNEDTKTWYNTWIYTITVLQPDGTLICYKNVVDKEKKFKLNQTIYSGEKLGEIAPGTSGLILMIYHNSMNTDDLSFVIPVFLIEQDKTGLVNSALTIRVVHPVEVRALEMTKKEQRKILGIKN